MDKKNRSQTPLILGVGGASLLLLFSFLIPLVFVCGGICPNISYIPFLIFGIIAVIGTVIGVKLRKLGLSLNILLGIIVLVYGFYTIWSLTVQNAVEGLLIPDYPGGLLIVPIIASVFLLAQGVSSYRALQKESQKVSE